MAYDKFTPKKADVDAVKAHAQAGGLVATNEAVQQLCDQVNAILDILATASTKSARRGRKPMVVTED